MCIINSSCLYIYFDGDIVEVGQHMTLVVKVKQIISKGVANPHGNIFIR